MIFGKQVSPATKIFLNEVGICLSCGGPANAMDFSSMRGNLPNASWWNVQAVAWVYYWGEMAAAGVDMIGASQFLGWPSGPPGTPTGLPAMAPSSGSLYQPQVTSWGNCPEMSMIDWVDGSGHAQFWTIKMLIEALGNADKHIYPTAVVLSRVANGTSPSCALIKQLSEKKCAIGRTFGCRNNGSMWTADGCGGVFACNGESVLCGAPAGPVDSDVGIRTICACLSGSGYYQRVYAVGLAAAQGTHFAA